MQSLKFWKCNTMFFILVHFNFSDLKILKNPRLDFLKLKLLQIQKKFRYNIIYVLYLNTMQFTNI